MQDARRFLTLSRGNLLPASAAAAALLLLLASPAAAEASAHNEGLDEGKRGWNNFQAGYGKRGWNNFGAGYGKRSVAVPSYVMEDDVEYPSAAYFDTYEDMAEEEPVLMSPAEKRAWNSGFSGMGKRAWNSGFSSGMGKRGWNSGFSAGMGKRAWNSGFSGMGKRAWNSGFSGMGKRGWNSGFSAGMGKRAWNSGFNNMGKRAWNSGFSSGMGKRSLEQQDDSADVSKRNWASVGIRGSWGKRAPSPQHKFVMLTPDKIQALHQNLLDKRTRGWLALRGLWGKKKRSAEAASEDVVEDAEDEVGPPRDKKPIPKVSEEELRQMFGTDQ